MTVPLSRNKVRFMCMQKSLFLIASFGILCATCFAQVSVKGYTKRDGTYVQPHTRSAPRGTSYNRLNSANLGQSAGSGLFYGQPYDTRRGSGTSHVSENIFEKSQRQPAVRHNYGIQSSGINRIYTPSGNENTSRVQVKGYLRNNGTYVEPYTRTTPNKTDNDNWSTKGNFNLDTGKPGYKNNNPWK